MNDLDDQAVRETLDRDGSFERNRDLPEQCRQAWESACTFALPDQYHGLSQVVITGMGGSAISGDFLQALAFGEASVPVSVIRGYELPNWVGADTLLIACSHSGDTEETLAAFEDALSREAKVVVITTGGRIRELAAARSLPLLTFDYPAEPRAALGHAFLRLIAVARAAGVLEVTDDRIYRAIDSIEQLRPLIDETTPTRINPAKQIAQRVHGRLPLIEAAGYLAPAARRWKTQINENAKSWAIADELPEMHHNTVVGLNLPESVSSLVHAIVLEHSGMSEPLRRRARLTVTLLDRAGISHERLEVGGDEPLQAILRAVYFANYVSYYLAMLNNVRPWETKAIDSLKQDLAAG